MSVSIGSAFGKIVHRIPKPCADLVLPFAKVGVEIECEQVGKLPPAQYIALWDSHEDHSLRNAGREFTTKGGLVGETLIEAIRQACEGFKQVKYSEGYPRAGIHLHIDVTDMNEKSDTQLLNMTLAYMMFEKALFSWAGDWRTACGFCDPLYLSQRDFSSLADLLYKWPDSAANLTERRFSKYQAVNFLPMARFGTVEFRHLPTTFDSERIIDWINLCLCFKRYGMETDIDPVDFIDRNGATALVNQVFGAKAGLIANHINMRELPAIALEVRALRVGQKSKPMLDSWDEPNNELLLSKRITKEAKPVKKKEAVAVEAAAVEAARPARRRPIRLHEVGGWETWANVNAPIQENINDGLLQNLHERERQLAFERLQARAMEQLLNNPQRGAR